MKRKDLIPALADLSQDIAGPIPVELVKEWTASGGTKAEHDALLGRYERHGAMVSSDTAGLSKMSVGASLVDVMKWVHEPKTVIYRCGKAVGGQAVGVWSADNTQMFYPDSVSVDDVVFAMVRAQREIEALRVNVGIGIHYGTVYHVAGGLFGKQADFIEDITEDESEGGQILVSKQVLQKLGPAFFHARPFGDVFEIDHKNLAVDVHGQEDAVGMYPAPFHSGFYRDLERYDGGWWQRKRMAWRYEREGVIILFRVFHERESKLLDEFLQQSYVNAFVHRELTKTRIELVKSNGSLAIFVTQNEKEAIHFGRTLLERAKNAGYKANVGIARGALMVFDLDEGGRDVAGSPINLASKLAEDTQERGRLFVDHSLHKTAQAVGVLEHQNRQISGVTIDYLRE